MARRRSPQTDSLELLLDTICNTFGGVVFIAILVVILLRVSGGRPSEQQSAETVSPEELQELKVRLTVAGAELERLRQTQAGQDELLERFAPDEIRMLVRERNELEAERRRLQSAHERRLTENASRQADIDQARAEVERLHSALPQARRELEQLQVQLDEERKARAYEVRMPVVHAAGLKDEIGLILRYGRMYVWHRYGPGGTRLGLNTDEFVVIEERFDGIITTPNPAAGIPLDDHPATAGRIRKRLAPFRPETAYLTVIVRPDSFEHFRRLRDVLIAQGFEYRLIPAADGDPIADRGGVGGRVQ